MWYMRTKEYYSSIKMGEVSIHASIWITLKILCKVKEASLKRLYIVDSII